MKMVRLKWSFIFSLGWLQCNKTRVAQQQRGNDLAEIGLCGRKTKDKRAEIGRFFLPLNLNIWYWQTQTSKNHSGSEAPQFKPKDCECINQRPCFRNVWALAEERSISMIVCLPSLPIYISTSPIVQNNQSNQPQISAIIDNFHVKVNFWMYQYQLLLQIDRGSYIYIRFRWSYWGNCKRFVKRSL